MNNSLPSTSKPEVEMNFAKRQRKQWAFIDGRLPSRHTASGGSCINRDGTVTVSTGMQEGVPGGAAVCSGYYDRGERELQAECLSDSLATRQVQAPFLCRAVALPAPNFDTHSRARARTRTHARHFGRAQHIPVALPPPPPPFHTQSSTIQLSIPCPAHSASLIAALITTSAPSSFSDSSCAWSSSSRLASSALHT